MSLPWEGTGNLRIDWSSPRLDQHLDGGFTMWQASYGEDATLTANCVKDIWMDWIRHRKRANSTLLERHDSSPSHGLSPEALLWVTGLRIIGNGERFGSRHQKLQMGGLNRGAGPFHRVRNQAETNQTSPDDHPRRGYL